ncbi:MAG: hypothetical protein Q9191_007465 [Dirinaria sp. TL-2023a]
MAASGNYAAHLPAEIRRQILSNCETSSLKQIRLVNSLWSVEGARWLFATIVVYVWASSFNKLRSISESRLSIYVRNILYIAEQIPHLSFQEWSDTIQGTGTNNSRVLLNSTVELGFKLYETLYLKQLQLFFQKADYKALNAALPHFGNLKRIELGNGRIIQSASKPSRFGDIHPSLRPLYKILSRAMRCDPAYISDIHRSMADQDAEEWQVPDTSAIVDRRAQLEELVLHDVQDRAPLFDRLWGEMAMAHRFFNKISPIKSLRIRVGCLNYHHILVSSHISAGEAIGAMNDIALFTQNLVSLELTFTARARQALQETESEALDDMIYLRHARWPRLRTLSIQGICVKETSLLEFLSGHNQTLAELVMTEVRFGPGAGSWRSFLQQKSQWKGMALQKAHFSRLSDSEFADGLASYPATAPIEFYILHGGELPDLMALASDL